MAIYHIVLTCALVGVLTANLRPSPRYRPESAERSPRYRPAAGPAPDLAPTTAACPAEPKRTWIIGYDVPWDNKQFIDENWNLSGLSRELIDAVCVEAGVDCAHVLASNGECWDTETNNGIGLQNKWFDACAMFYRTEERLRVFKFTSQFYARERGYYWVKACSGTQVNDNDLSALNVGVIDHWAYTAECLVTKNRMSVKSIEKFDYANALHELRTGGVDVVFAARDTFDGESGVEKIEEAGPLCHPGCAALMHRHDSNIGEWFNPAYDVVRDNGQLEGLCHKWNVTACNLQPGIRMGVIWRLPNQ